MNQSDNQNKEGKGGLEELLPKQKRSRWWIWALVVIGLIVIGLGYSYFSGEEESKYITENPSVRDIFQSVTVTGTIQPAQEIDLNFKGAGTIQTMLVDVGDKVNQGEVMAALDTSELQSQADQAAANVDVAEAQLQQTLEGSRPEEITIKEANVRNAETLLKSAEENYQIVLESIQEDNKTAQNNLKNTQNLLDDAIKNVDNIEQQNEQNIKNTIDNNINQVNLVLIDEDSILQNIQEIWDNAQWYKNFNSINFTRTNNINNLLSQANSQRATASLSYQNALLLKDEISSQQAINDTVTYLNTVTQILNNLNAMLYQDNADKIFTATDLSALQGRQTSNETSHNANLANALSLSNALDSTKISNQIALDNAQQQITNYSNQISTAQDNITQTELNGKTRLQTAQDQLNNAIDQLDIQRANLDLTKSGPTPAAVAVAQAQVRAAQASYNTVLTQIENQKIIAPVTGTITQVNAEPGEQSNSANPIIQLHSDAEYEITADIAETDIDKIDIGDKAEITFDALTKLDVFEGTVTFIDPAATTIQGVVYYQTKVILDADDNRIKPGMTANIEVITAEQDQVLTVPNQSVKTVDGKTVVDILINEDKDEIETREVVTGTRGNTHIEVITGVTESDRVIILINE